MVYVQLDNAHSGPRRSKVPASDSLESRPAGIMPLAWCVRPCEFSRSSDTPHGASANIYSRYRQVIVDALGNLGGFSKMAHLIWPVIRLICCFSVVFSDLIFFCQRLLTDRSSDFSC